MCAGFTRKATLLLLTHSVFVCTIYTTVFANVVPFDFLGGIGDFETVTDTRWVSRYTGDDYSFLANSGYVSPISTSGEYSGFDTPETDDTVAAGWFRDTSATVNPGSNIVCRVVDGGVGNSKCQYIALKGITEGTASIHLKSAFRIRNDDGGGIRAGDKVTFRVDHLRMDGYTGIPPGTSLSFRIAIADTGIEGGHSVAVLTPSSTAFGAEVSYTIPDGLSYFAVMVMISCNGSLGDKQPGFYIDGAHLYVTRQGTSSYETREIPALKSRGIKTHQYLYYDDAYFADAYSTAAKYDYVIVTPMTNNVMICVPKLRYANPDIKLYLYQSGTMIWDARDSNGNDPWNSGSPFGMKYVLENHPEWLNPNGVGGYVTQPGYPGSYQAKIANTTYQSLWADRVIEKAKRYGFDGVFIDDMGERSEIYDGDKKTCAALEPWELQQFIHAVSPRLSAAGLEMMRNGASQDYDSGPGQVYFDPSWTPKAPYDSSKYSTNTPINVGNGHMDEWGFFMMTGFIPGGQGNYTSNVYHKLHWKRSLDNMDMLKLWNTRTGSDALTTDTKKRLYAIALGVNRNDDPMNGVNGWLQFSLCSYLLAQNEWTSFGCGERRNMYAPIDYSITKRLGVPDGTHQLYGGDQYCRYRRYKSTQTGELGGIVVVNGNHDVSRTYTVESNLEDESGNLILSGTTITLPPHTGRILLNPLNPVDVSINVPTQNVRPGQQLTITVNYCNMGNDEATNVVIRAVVPSQMKYVAGSAEASGGHYISSSNTVSWTISTLAAGQDGSKTFQARVN